MGARSCGPLRSRVPAFLDFSFAFRVPLHYFFRVPLYSRVPVSRSYAPVSTSVCVGVGCNSSHSRCMCMDGSGGPGQLATAPLTTPPRHACAVYEYTGRKPVWGQTHISSTIPPFHLSSPPLPRHNCVNSSQEHEFSVPFLSRSTFLYKICVTARPRS